MNVSFLHLFPLEGALLPALQIWCVHLLQQHQLHNFVKFSSSVSKKPDIIVLYDITSKLNCNITIGWLIAVYIATTGFGKTGVKRG